MKKKIFLVFSFAICMNLAGVILLSCRTGCGEGSNIIRTDSLKSQAWYVHGLRYKYSADSSLYATWYTGNKIKYDSIAIEITPSMSRIAQKISDDYSMISTAYACEPVFRNDEEIKNVVITSSKEYGPGFSAGTDLKSIMKASYGFTHQSGAVSEKLVNQQQGLGTVLYRFTEPPSSDLSMDLTFRYELSSGKFFEKTVKNIHIKK